MRGQKQATKHHDKHIANFELKLSQFTFQIHCENWFFLKHVFNREPQYVMTYTRTLIYEFTPGKEAQMENKNSLLLP